MRWEEWRFSAARAWQDRAVRWMTLVTAFFDCLIVGLFIAKIIPLTAASGMATFHYNIYLGVDDVRPWEWMLLPAGVMLGVLLINSLTAFGVYRKDAIAARALTGLSVVISLLWAMTLYYLVTINR